VHKSYKQRYKFPRLRLLCGNLYTRVFGTAYRKLDDELLSLIAKLFKVTLVQQIYKLNLTLPLLSIQEEFY
jgi:hypothetical protein